MQIAYRPDIDGLRAVAVLSVLGFHFFPEWFPGGYIGVDVFFVISGYLITSILIKEHDAGSWSIASFYARRILRIFPALILVLLFCLLLGWHVLLADEYKQLGKHIAAGAGFFSNIALWQEAGYFDRSSELKPLLHLWSLGIEEQFYIFWPLILWAAWQYRGKLTVITAVLALASLIAGGFLVWEDKTQAFYSPMTRGWELLSGSILAIHGGRVKFPNIASTHQSMIQLGSIFVFVISVLFLNEAMPFPGFLALIPVIITAILITTTTKGTFGHHILSWKPLVLIGLISYPLYLWHWPLLSFTRILTSHSPTVELRFLLLIASLLLAIVTYWFVEKPMRGLRKRWLIALLASILALIGALGFNVFSRDGLERIRYKRMIELSEDASIDFTDFEKVGLITDIKCETPFRFPEKDVCLIADPSKPVSAAVVGDSHALHAYWGLARAFEKHGLNLKVYGKGACVPFLDHISSGDSAHCQPFMNLTLKNIAQDPRINAVVLIHRGRYLKESSSQSEIDAYKQQLDRTISMLERANKKIYYFMPVVEPGFDPRLCIGALPLGRKRPESCVIDEAQDAVKWLKLKNIIAEVYSSHPDISIVDPNVYLCKDYKCPIILNGRSVFKDENHLSYFGSLLIGDQINLN